MMKKIVGILIMCLFIGVIIVPNIIGSNSETSEIIYIKKNFKNHIQESEIEKCVIISPPIPKDTSDSIVDITNVLADTSENKVILSNVPTSKWTYGCCPTAAGMLFGYYDRTGYNNMYTGPTNGGVCPLTNLGQGIGTPISGSCYIIATQKGFDGINTKAHVDDYWISLSSPGPDPWESNWYEHTWSLCVADFIGASQWKWDLNVDGHIDRNPDGASTMYISSDGSKLYDYIPFADQGLPRTAFCHGCKLFAQSRGYSVYTNYVQLANTPMGDPNGFTFYEFKAEIDAGRPVLTYWESSSYSHVMLGVGYDSTANTIYFHDTWDNNLHECSWTGTYSGYNLKLKGVLVIQLAPLPTNNPPSSPSNPNPTTHSTDIEVDSNLSWECDDPDGDWLAYEIYFGTESPPSLVQSVEITQNYNPGKMEYNTKYYWKIVAKDCRGESISGPIWDFTSCENQNPDIPTITGKINGGIEAFYEYTIQTTDPYQDDVKYYIDWGDGNTMLTGLNESGKQIIVSHMWSTKGAYTIKVKAIDEYGAESDWATLTVSMPKYKMNYQLDNLFERFLHYFPFFEKIQNQII